MAFVILEDDDDRFFEMSRVLRDGGTAHEIVRFTRADECIGWLSGNILHVAGLSLDHDLIDQTPGAPDPGDGREVAQWLARQGIKPPVVVHSSNFAGAAAMHLILTRAGFSVSQVYPLGNDWITTDWRAAVALKKTDR